MINRKNLWFVTLFSLILVLSIFYVSMNENDIKGLIENSEITDDTTLVVNQSTELVALRVQSDEEVLKEMEELQNILLSETADVSEKNDAYDNLLMLSSNKGAEQEIEKIIKKEFNYDSFVKINADTVTVVIDSDEHDYGLANKIIRKVQEKFENNKYITVKFN